MATYRGSKLEQNGRSLVEGRNAGMHRGRTERTDIGGTIGESDELNEIRA
jgi:hypothetical protein